MAKLLMNISNLIDSQVVINIINPFVLNR